MHVAVGDDDAGDSGVQDYLSVIESPAMDSKKTELITAMLRSETRPHVLKVFSEGAMWRGQGEKGYFHGAPEDWNCVAAALRSEALSALATIALDDGETVGHRILDLDLSRQLAGTGGAGHAPHLSSAQPSNAHRFLPLPLLLSFASQPLASFSPP
jgi:hypothetical protein